MSEDDPERIDLELREADLRFVHGRQWAVEPPKWGGDDLSGQFRRGFPDHLSLSAADFLKRGRTLFAAAPITTGFAPGMASTTPIAPPAAMPITPTMPMTIPVM